MKLLLINRICRLRAGRTSTTGSPDGSYARPHGRRLDGVSANLVDWLRD